MEDLLDFFNIVLCFRCCRQHDLCYESLPKRPCSSSFFGPYFTFYTWTIIRTTSGSNSSSQGQRSGTLAIRCGKHFRFIFRFSIRLSNCTTSVWGCFFFQMTPTSANWLLATVTVRPLNVWHDIQPLTTRPTNAVASGTGSSNRCATIDKEKKGKKATFPTEYYKGIG